MTFSALSKAGGEVVVSGVPFACQNPKVYPTSLGRLRQTQQGGRIPLEQEGSEMTMMLQGGPFKAPVAGLHRFSVKQYQKMIENGVITEDDDLELLEGYLVEKMSRNAPHDGGLDLMRDALYRLLPVDWWMRVQEGVALRDSVPEPDIAVVRGNARTYLKRHPAPADVGVVMEISDSSLDNDRDDKTRIYASQQILLHVERSIRR